MGQDALRLYAGLLMVAAYVAGVVGTWTLVRGYSTFPTLLYLLTIIVVMVIFITASLAIPKVTECHEFSKTMLNVIWETKGRIYWGSRLNQSKEQRRKYNIWKKVKKAQRALVFYYGSAQFNKETKTKFFNIILNNAVSLILVT